jgi:hypothetical protein
MLGGGGLLEYELFALSRHRRTLKMEALRFFETSLTTYHFTRRNIPEDSVSFHGYDTSEDTGMQPALT